jgi:hypothetical protein
MGQTKYRIFHSRLGNIVIRSGQILIWIALLLVSDSVLAVRRVEKRDDATNIFIGTVKIVNAEKGKGLIRYDVEVTVEKVEKGLGIRSDDVIHVRCYMRDPDWLKSKTLTKEDRKRDALLRDSSYKSVPKKGNRVRIYANDGGDHYNGIYPDWFDLI